MSAAGATIEVARAALLLGGGLAWLVALRASPHTSRSHAGAALAFLWAVLTLAMVSGAGFGLPLAPGMGPHLAGAPLCALLTAALGCGPLVHYGLADRALALRTLAGACLAAGGLALYLDAGAIGAGRAAEFATGALALAALVTLPAQALAQWTADSRRDLARSLLQGFAWLALLLWLFPSVAFVATGESWAPLLARSTREHALWLPPLLVPLGIVTAAVWQFAREGGGTGFPFDPPHRLVTGGIYATVRNPMQIGIVLLMAWWGVVLQSPLVAGMAPVAALLFVVFRDVCSGASTLSLTDPAYASYIRNVPAWRMRRTPWQGL